MTPGEKGYGDGEKRETTHNEKGCLGPSVRMTVMFRGGQPISFETRVGDVIIMKAWGSKQRTQNAFFQGGIDQQTIGSSHKGG